MSNDNGMLKLGIGMFAVALGTVALVGVANAKGLLPQPQRFIVGQKVIVPSVPLFGRGTVIQFSRSGNTNSYTLSPDLAGAGPTGGTMIVTEEKLVAV